MLLIIVSAILSILIFVKKKDLRKAFFAFITAQTVTWALGILMVYFGVIEYPVRLFPKAVDNSFLNGFILNPTIFAIYYIHYPKQAKLIWRWVYTLLITAIPMLMGILENKYTNLIHYKAWNGFYGLILGLIFYYILRKYIDWFFKNAQKKGVLRNEA